MKLSSLETIFYTLNQANIRFLVAGDIAVNTHGYQRMTSDLDMVIQLESHNFKNAMTSLKSLDYNPLIPVTADDFAAPNKRNLWIETKNMQVLSLQSNEHPETTIDIFVSEPFNFNAEYEKSTTAEITPEITFQIVSIATLMEI